MTDTEKERHRPAAPPSTRVRKAERINLALLALSAVGAVVFGIVYFADGSVHAGHTQRSGWAPFLGCLVLVCLFGAAALIRPFRMETRRCALMATVASLIFALGIGTIWQIVSHDKVTDTIVGTPLMSTKDTSAYMKKTFPGVKLRYIPTGVFIQGSKFASPQEVEVSGYVWQRYSPDIPESSMGVVFPEAPDGYSLDEAYDTKTTDGQRLKGWHFNLTLRQKFDYAQYPLDKQNIWLRMWSNATFTNDVLVPDFASYPPWKYGEIGLDQDIVTSGWAPYFTGWSFDQHKYTMTQGLQDWNKPFVAAPELYFNVGMERSWAGPLAGKLLQSFFIAAIMFLALFVYTKDDNKNPRFGFSTWTAISFSVSLLLVVVVDQTQIREIAGDTSLTYLEYFAIAQYIVIMGIFANAILIGSETKFRALEWQDNLLPTLLYWPVLIGLFFVFTLFVFAT
ncbi:hypothetical protein [Streptomyces sp. NBC_01465]|uniref:hypothetical protein n=1 Tax=Streptomyces sp. NBC_01465 TaxID=2903878 RepID=UPI002E2FF77D|nr:hypothetical protein [Streptomyces sp. NBC_01465]